MCCYTSYRYDRSDGSFRQLVDVQLIAAMGPPGGGRNPVTPRFLRHFNMIAVNEFEDATYARIYGAISDWWARRAKLPEEIAAKGASIVTATVEIYNTIKKELLPTPAKSHYTYNMRDLSKVFQVGLRDFDCAFQMPTVISNCISHLVCVVKQVPKCQPCCCKFNMADQSAGQQLAGRYRHYL